MLGWVRNLDSYYSHALPITNYLVKLDLVDAYRISIHYT